MNFSPYTINKTLLYQAIMIASMSSYASTAWSECPGIVEDEEVVNGCMLTGDDEVIIESGGVIDVNPQGTHAITITASTDVNINNNGTIAGNDGAGIASTGITDAGFSGHIVNDRRGLITGGTAGIIVESLFADGLSNNSTITNHGTIRVEQTTGFGNAGILVGGPMRGLIDNTGTISVSADVGNNPSGAAVGIMVTADLSGTINNTGSIMISGEGNDIGVNAMSVNGDLTGEGMLENSGKLRSSVTGDDFANAYGMLVVGDMKDHTVLRNSGDINVTAHGISNYSRGFGIRVLGSIENNSLIESTDTINVSATLNGDTGDTATLVAAGMHIGTLNAGQVINRGDITVSGSGEAIAYDTALVAGIFVDTLTFDGTLLNEGSVSASAAGTVTEATEAYSVYIEAGNGTFTNATSGMLTGGFYAGDTVNVINCGIIHATLNNNVYIGGNYQQTEHGIAAIDVLDTKNFSTWQVDGELQGTTLRMHVLPDAVLTAGDILEDVLSSGHLLSDDWVVLSNNVRYSFDPLVSGNKLSVTTLYALDFKDVVVDTGFIYASGAAHALDIIEKNHLGNADMSRVIETLNALPTLPALGAAVAQFVPTLLGQTIQYGVQTSLRVTDAINQRLSHIRAGQQGYSSGNGMYTDKHLWVRAFGTHATQDNEKRVPGYDVDGYGITLGFDAQVSEQWLIGGALGYTHASLDGNTVNTNTVDIDGSQVAAYGSFMPNTRDVLDVIAVIGANQNESRRHIDFEGLEDGPRQAHVDYEGWYTRFYASFGRHYTILNDLTVTPVINVTYSYIYEEGYQENGANSLNLHTKSRDADSLIVGVDGIVAYNFDAQQRYRLNAHAGVGYDFLTDQTVISASYAGGGPVFTSSGIAPDKWVYRAGAGFTAQAMETLTLAIHYYYQGRSSFDQQLLEASVRQAF